MEDRINAQRAQAERGHPQPIREILAELLTCYAIRHPQALVAVVETKNAGNPAGILSIY